MTTKQLPVLLQQPPSQKAQQTNGSKLPPINELLKTSVGLLRPVNLASSNTTSSNATGQNVQPPQPMFRYPYGMPAESGRPPIYATLVSQPSSQNQQTASLDQSNKAASHRIIVFQDQATKGNNSQQSSVVIVHPPNNETAPSVEDSKSVKPKRCSSSSPNSSKKKRIRRTGDIQEEVSKLKKELSMAKRNQVVLKEELKTSRAKLSAEIKARGVDRIKIHQLQEEILQMKAQADEAKFQATENVKNCPNDCDKLASDLQLLLASIESDDLTSIQAIARKMTEGSCQKMALKPSNRVLRSDFQKNIVENSTSEAELKLFCPQCQDFSASSLKSLLIHLGRKHQYKQDAGLKRSGLNTKCEICGESSKDVMQLAVHYLKCHNSNSFDKPPFGCLMCPFLSPQQWDVIVHLASTHLVPRPASEQLGKVEQRPSSSHSSGNSSCLLCICKHCPYRTERYTDMRKHALRRHGDENAFERREATDADPEVALPCGVCSSKFFRPGDLKRHRTRYKHFLEDFKDEAMSPPMLKDIREENYSIEMYQCESQPRIHFLAPKLNLAARFYCRVMKRFWTLKRRRQHEFDVFQHHCSFDSDLSATLRQIPLMPHFGVDEVTDLFSEAPPSPDLALLISNSDIKTLCDFPGDVERLLSI